MSGAVKRARQIAEKVLEGQFDPLLACRELVDLRDQLPMVGDEVMDVLRAVDSEVDGVPIGPEREHWSAGSLRVKDVEAAGYREQVRSVVSDALRTLLEATESDSHL